jgi:hypothetical protein
VTQEITHSDPVCRYRIVEPKLRDVIAHRLVQSRRSSLCRSATAVAVNVFVIEPMRNCVEG